MNRSDVQNRPKRGHLESTNSSIPNRQACEKDDQCGLWAECVALTPNQPKRCWCVSDLESPDPDTGGCRSVSSGLHQDRARNGVLFPHHLQDIVMSADDNVTAHGGRTPNESSSMLQLPTVESSSMSWKEITLPALGSFMFVSILIALTLIYRRRFMIKQYCASRHPDTVGRHNDGTILLDRMNHIKNNPTYFCHNSGLTRRHHVPEVSCHHLKLEEVVGEGAFGQVFRGNLLNPENATYRQVAVKVLRDGSTSEARDDFEREVETMSAFDHDNILKLLGIIVQGIGGNPYMIFEYMEHGDLSELLRNTDPLLRNPHGKSITFSKADLVDVCVQIANGMSYLAAQRFVHRDLATRNCLVGIGLIVKISDFGMSRDIYTSDYYKVGGSRLLPVRWMSPEAIKYGHFTCESDIWAYGVVLWEIFSYGKQPYCGHTNDEVIHFLDQGILLQRPEDCPSTVYHVMLGCWKRDPRERIVFERLAKYLTDFRNRLAKPAQSPQQCLPDLAISGGKFQNSDINVYVVGIPEKGGVILDPIHNQYTQHVTRPDPFENSAEQLNYICIGDFPTKDSGFSIANVAIESPAHVTTACVINGKSLPSAKHTSKIHSRASHTSGSIGSLERQQANSLVTKDSSSTRNVSPIQATCLRDVFMLNQPTDSRSVKSPARKTSSYPLSLQTEKQSDQQTLYTNKDIINKLHISCGSNTLPTPASCILTYQHERITKSSSSALELCPPLTSLSESPNMTTYELLEPTRNEEPPIQGNQS